LFGSDARDVTLVTSDDVIAAGYRRASAAAVRITMIVVRLMLLRRLSGEVHMGWPKSRGRCGCVRLCGHLRSATCMVTGETLMMVIETAASPRVSVVATWK
jgi:hypothetical protein